MCDPRRYFEVITCELKPSFFPCLISRFTLEAHRGRYGYKDVRSISDDIYVEINNFFPTTEYIQVFLPLLIVTSSSSDIQFQFLPVSVSLPSQLPLI